MVFILSANRKAKSTVIIAIDAPHISEALQAPIPQFYKPTFEESL
jgi:hypothetical protein